MTKDACPDCGKSAKDWSGCARVVCPKRRQVHEHHRPDWHDDPSIQPVEGGFIRTPTTRDDE